MNGEDGRIYMTASLKIKLAGLVLKLNSIQKDSGLLFTKERRDKVRQLRQQEDKLWCCLLYVSATLQRTRNIYTHAKVTTSMETISAQHLLQSFGALNSSHIINEQPIGH
jgi:hypothetical protein